MMLYLCFLSLLLPSTAYHVLVGGPAGLTLLDQDAKVVSTLITLGTVVYGPSDGFIEYGVSGVLPPFLVTQSIPGRVLSLSNNSLDVDNNCLTGGDIPVHVSSDGDFVYVTNGLSKTISVLSRTTLRILDIQEVGIMPQGVFQKGSTYFIPCKGSDEIYEFVKNDNGTLIRGGNVLLQSLTPPMGPRTMVFDEDSAYILTEYSREVHIYSLVDGRISFFEGVVPLLTPDGNNAFTTPMAMIYHDNRLYITIGQDRDYVFPDNGYLAVIDLATQETTYKTIGKTPQDIALLPDKKQLILCYFDDDIVEIMTMEGESVKNISVSKPLNVAVWE
jgi:DNA-binding beta-propeller fold protein YncE